MKKLTFMLFSMLALLAGFSSCSSDDDKDGNMSNYVSIVADGNSIINEDDEDGVKFNVLLGNTLTSDATITLSLQGNEDGVATIEPATINLKAGDKTASFTVKSNNKSLLSVARVLTVVPVFSDANMKSDGKTVTVTINPDSDIPELTEAQLQLIEGYKTNLNIDLTKVLGKRKVSTKVTFNDDDKTETFNSDDDSRTFTGNTVITLSDKATADKPVLKMTANAMGLAAFNYEMLRKVTVEDTEYFNNDEVPYAKAIMNNINYDFNNETFTMTLDGIEVNSDLTLNFTGTKVIDEETSIVTVPFDYTYSVWSRLEAAANQGQEWDVKELENDKEVVNKMSVQDLIDYQGWMLNPSKMFDITDVNEDADATDYPNIYIAPAGKIDFANDKMTFAFPWYFYNTYGCQRVEATYEIGK